MHRIFWREMQHVKNNFYKNVLFSFFVFLGILVYTTSASSDWGPSHLSAGTAQTSLNKQTLPCLRPT